MKNYSKLVKTGPSLLLHGQSALYPTQIHREGAMHVENPFYGVRWVRMDKWQRQCARWKIMESSRNFCCDTYLPEFT